eukprot:CAMPEP_0202954224 /NCGR_PEP_ID=MMETSP1395-20130829/50639_1 /ASSEMBLY_ACC=CAM_ASM_000871 /TAXON_ID=5961 /ORGANISM="Blepharisma japonicum, Strain Stock R1072" /LENGTH=90 /DNA_ID=CAMNT_0049669621 /DNA_START=1188 /DNA_END=1460 /DNA_ORIENTATION=+
MRMVHDKEPFEGSILKKKGKGDEEIYFNKREKEQLRNLLHKLEDAAGEPELTVESDRETKAKLLAVLAKHNIRASESLLDDIVSWKKGIN